MSKPQFKQVIAETNDLSDDSMSILRRKFGQNKLVKAIWNSIPGVLSSNESLRAK